LINETNCLIIYIMLLDLILEKTILPPPK
jgi:hypothetical protein